MSNPILFLLCPGCYLCYVAMGGTVIMVSKGVSLAKDLTRLKGTYVPVHGHGDLFGGIIEAGEREDLVTSKSRLGQAIARCTKTFPKEK